MTQPMTPAKLEEIAGRVLSAAEAEISSFGAPPGCVSLALAGALFEAVLRHGAVPSVQAGLFELAFATIGVMADGKRVIADLKRLHVHPDPASPIRH